MPRSPASEPFREQACPLGVCDGSGWILGPEDVARPCECREQRLKKGRSPRHRLGDPAAATAASPSTGRRSPTWRGTCRRTLRRSATSGRTSRTSTRKLAEGRGLWLIGGHRHRQDDAGDADREGGARGRQDGRDLLHAEAAGPDPPDLPGRPRAGTPTSPSSSASPRSTSSTSTTSAPSGTPTGCVEQLYALVNERYESAALDAGHEQRAQRRPRTIDTAARSSADQIGRRTVSRLIEICGDPLPLFGSRPARPGARGRATLRTASAIPAVMPGVVIVGAQWGDEGKGKVVDLLAERRDDDRPLPGRQQRRPHDRPRRRGVQVPPDPLRDPARGQDLRDRQRRRRRPAASCSARSTACKRARDQTSATCGSPPTRT